MAPRDEAAANPVKFVKSKSSVVVAVCDDSAKVNQKFENSKCGKSNSTARSRAMGCLTKACTAHYGQSIKCSKCHKRVTGEQATKLRVQYVPEPESRTTANAGNYRESESLASLVKRRINEFSSIKETIGALCQENTAMKPASGAYAVRNESAPPYHDS